MALDRSVRRLRPEQRQSGAGVVVPLAAPARARCRRMVSAVGEPRPAFRDASSPPRCRGAEARRAPRRAGAASIVCVGAVLGQAVRPLRARGRSSASVDAGDTPRIRQRAAAPLAAGIARARSGGRPGCRCRPTRRIAGRAAAGRACRTSCRNGRGTARGPASSRASPPAARRPRPCRPSRSRAPLTADSRYRPRLVGRGPVRDDRLRILLEVVRRQQVLRRRHEGLEEAPGAARDQAQGARIASARHRQAAGDARRAELVQRAMAARAIQSADERRRHWPGRRARPPRGRSRPRRRDGDAAAHPPIEPEEVEPRAAPSTALP